MARAIENIPYHCFNMHDKCGTCCSYHENPESYVHSNIGDGFHDVTLFECLKDIFNILASKSSLFVAGASRNANESLNAMIVSKAPKTRLYGKSAASDIRVASAVNKKNSEEKYCIDVATKLSSSPGRYSKKYIEKVDYFSYKRYEKSLTRIEK